MSTKTSNHLLKLPGAGKNGLAKGKKTRKDKEKKKTLSRNDPSPSTT